MLRRHDDMESRVLVHCHDGEGQLDCFTVLQRGDSQMGIAFMHDDRLEPNASIGVHPHTDSEEVYFVVEGQGTMILDGERYPIGPGDVSLVEAGHSHGLINGNAPMRLIVVGLRR